MGFGKNNTGVIITDARNQALGALSANDVIKIGTPLVLVEDFRLLKAEAFAQITGLVAVEGEGLILGIANNELSVTEIKEAIDGAQGPTSRNDRVSEERATRAVWLVGKTSVQSFTETRMDFLDGNTGGTKIVTKPRWTFSDPEGWAWFVYNSSLTITTGATVRLTSKVFGVWVT